MVLAGFDTGSCRELESRILVCRMFYHRMIICRQFYRWFIKQLCCTVWKCKHRRLGCNLWNGVWVYGYGYGCKGMGLGMGMVGSQF